MTSEKGVCFLEIKFNNKAHWKDFEKKASKIIDLKLYELHHYIRNVKLNEKNLQPYFDEWWGMPELIQKCDLPAYTVKVRVMSNKALKKLTALFLNKETTQLGSQRIFSKKLHGHHKQEQKIWYPPRFANTKYMECYVREGKKKRYNPKFPVYIVSKGRWKSRLTSTRLEESCVPYKIVVEPEEYKKYCAVIDPKKVLKLPENYSKTKNQGSIPARNWIWDHAKKNGAKRHWILDDNIQQFSRLNDNKRIKCIYVGALFAAAEDFVCRYNNVALAGFHHEGFVIPNVCNKPFNQNTRIYSCILIDTSLPFKWRGKYNEDTDLSLRILKAGYATILFNAFLMKKCMTMTMKGGNTDDVYKNGRLEFAKSLQKQHPDVVRVTFKFNRVHHQINYKPFKNNPLKKKKTSKQHRPYVNNYDMKVQKCKK